MTFFDSGAWVGLMTLIGEVTFFLILGMVLAAVALAIIATASITRGKFYRNRSGHPFTTPCSYPSYHNPPFLKIRPYNR